MKLTSRGRAAVTSLVDMSINMNDGQPKIIRHILQTKYFNKFS